MRPIHCKDTKRETVYTKDEADLTPFNISNADFLHNKPSIKTLCFFIYKF